MNEMSGELLKAVLEDVADNLFNPDPYYQQGGDMVRVAGLQYNIAPAAAAGERVGNLRFRNQPVDASKSYKVAGWASVHRVEGESIWDVVGRWLRSQKVVGNISIEQPKVTGLSGNFGFLD